MNPGLALLLFFCLLAVLFTFVRFEITLSCYWCGRRVPWGRIRSHVWAIYTLPLKDWFNQLKRNRALNTPICEWCQDRYKRGEPYGRQRD